MPIFPNIWDERLQRVSVVHDATERAQGYSNQCADTTSQLPGQNNAGQPPSVSLSLEGVILWGTCTWYNSQGTACPQRGDRDARALALSVGSAHLGAILTREPPKEPPWGCVGAC